MRTSPHLSDDELLLELVLVETEARQRRLGERLDAGPGDRIGRAQLPRPSGTESPRAEQVMPRGYRGAAGSDNPITFGQ